MIVAARRGRARGLTDLQSVGRTAQTPVFIGQYGNAPDPCQHYVSGATESAALHGRAALDGKTVRRQRLATVRQPSAAPILSIRNGSHRRGGTSPAWYVRRFSPLRSPASAVAYLSTLRYVARCCQWVGGFVPSGVFAGIGSHMAHEPAFSAYSPVGPVEGSSLVSVAPPAVGSAAAGAVSSHTVRFRTGPSGELNLPSGPECALRSRGSVRERSGRVFVVPDRRKGAIALYGALTRSGGVSRETKARYGDQCALPPRKNVHEWASRVFGVPDCAKAAMPLYGPLTRSQGPSAPIGKVRARGPPNSFRFTEMNP